MLTYCLIKFLTCFKHVPIYISCRWESCFWSPDKYWSIVPSSFSSVLVSIKLLKEMSDAVAAERSILSSSSLTLSLCSLMLDRLCTMGAFYAAKKLLAVSENKADESGESKAKQ